MKYRMLGKELKVSAVGMGVMGFSHGDGTLYAHVWDDEFAVSGEEL